MSLGVYPNLFLAFISKFVFDKRYSRLFKLPYSAAQWSAVDSSKSLRFGSDPFSINNFTISGKSISAAIWSAVFFSYAD